MQAFLEQVALKILEKHENDLLQVCVVTPNRRAALFLAKHFSNLIKKQSWAPEVMGMEDFAGKISRLSISEPVTLILDLYHVYEQMEGEKAEPLDEFLKWAPLLIRDFNDIDAHVAEPEKLYSNILDLKNIEAWNPDGSPPTVFQKKYISFFEKTYTYHKKFKNHLKEKGTAYQGLAYRQAAEMITEGRANVPWAQIYFTGFNALNYAEEVIIRTLTRNGKAKSFWDADKYYLNNKHHEAGIFLRKYFDQWNPDEIDFIGDHFSIKSKKINIYGVAKNVNQAKLAGNILSSFPTENISNHQTAVVLANEELLLPLMNSIPENIDTLNITMGYPLRKTSLYSFFDSVFQLHLTTYRMKTARKDSDTAFYHKDILRILNHPMMKILWDKDEASLTEILKKISGSKRAFFTFPAIASFCNHGDWLKERFGFLFEALALDITRSLEVMDQLIKVLHKSFVARAKEKGILLQTSPWFTDFESLFPLGIIIRKLGILTNENKPINDFRLLFMLFQAMAKETKLPLSGEPLSGLQVMGMLETRNLDFKNIIILSANEDILPAAKSNNSLIPFDVKAKFGMPVYKEKDAIYAYHFYRLLQRAENIHIIYNTQARDLGSSEKSRFITQLQMEMPAWNPNIVIDEKIIALPSASDDFDHEIIIQKTPEIFEKLEEINTNGFSPSTLNNYIRCSLFFYFRHIAGISENETVEETMEARTLGIVLHETLEQLYNDTNILGKELKPEYIDDMLKSVEKVMMESFERNYSGGDITSGKNLLLLKVAGRYLKNFLILEKKSLEGLQAENKHLIYLRSEEILKATSEIHLNGNPKTINFKGFADRVDQLDGTIRIIDYKSGKVEKDELRFSQWPDVTQNTKLGKSFQLLMYAMLYKQTHSDVGEIIPGIFSLRNIRSGLLTLLFPGGKESIGENAISEFEKELQELMQEIFSENIPFERTKDIDNCKNCDFRIVCNRQ